MIPLRDVIPSRTAPVVTIVLIAAHVGGFWSADPLLVGSSMMMLWLFGGTVEDRMGHGRFFLFYLLCGFAGGGFRGPHASAALAGVIAAYFGLYPRSRILMLFPIPYLVRIVEVPAILIAAAWLLVQVTILGPDLRPQMIGLAVGIAAVWLFRQRERMRVEWWNDLDYQRANFSRSRRSVR